MKIIYYKNIVAFVYMLVLSSSLVFSEESTAQEYTLRYTVYENINYLIERTITWTKGGDSNSVETGHQEAIISYGPQTGKRGGIMTSHVTLLDEDVQSDQYFAKFRPVERRSPGGHWHLGWRWGTSSMARDHDMFPVFPEKAVSVGDQWQIEGKLLIPCYDGRAEGKITHTFEALENVDGITCARIGECVKRTV